MKKTNDFKKKYFMLLIIFIFAISLGIRLFAINKTMYDDEATRAFAIKDNDFFENLVGGGTWHPPMYSWLAMMFTSTLGFSNIAFRSMHIIFGILTIYLTFTFTNRYFGEKAALWTAAIMGFSYYHIIASALITIDGSILAFFYLLTLYCFMRYFENKDSEKEYKKNIKILNTKIDYWLILTGVSFGLAFLTKISAILIIPVIIAYSLLKNRKIMPVIFDTFVVGVVGCLIFSIYIILSLFNSSGLTLLFERAGDVVSSSSVNLSLLAIQFLLAAVWIGPFLPGMLLLVFISNIKKSERDDRTYLLMIFIAVIFIFYIFILKDNFRPVERYLMAITGPLCILAGAYLSKIRFEKKHLTIFLIVLITFSGFLFWLNAKENEFIPFYPKETFVQKAISLDWKIYVPLIGNEGPLGFYLSLDSIIYSFIFSFLALAIYILINQSMHIKKHKLDNRSKQNGSLAVSVFVVFIAISAAFNILIVEEHLFSKINPDVDKISKEIIDYSNNNELKTPLFYFRNFAMQFYTWEKYGKCHSQNKIWWSDCTIDFGDENNVNKINLIKNGGTVLIVNFPEINKESLLWRELNECKKIKSFYDKGQEIGFIVEC